MFAFRDDARSDAGEMPERLIARRDLLRCGVATGLALAWQRARAAESRLRLRVVETAGLRRFGYPVHTVLPGLERGPNFLLSSDGKPVPAQFRPIVRTDGRPCVALDFNVSLGPLETMLFDVAYGEDVPPGPEPQRGLRVEKTEKLFRVSGTGLTYEVPVDLVGFLVRVDEGSREYVRAGSPGFWIQTRGGQEERKAPPLHGTISRQGPLAVGLEFRGNWPLDGGRMVPVAVELTFPSSKSWVEARWTIDEPEAESVVTIGLDLDIAIDGSPTLVDLGAGGTVYGTIRGDERIGLSAHPQRGWQIHKSSNDASVLQATGLPGGPSDPHPEAEGWAHVMDATRCTAIAVSEFGRRTLDRIELAANGRVRLARNFGDGPQIRRAMRAWFHFVGMPVQVGAVTSPQSMLTPLKVIGPSE